ncbi:hypothetical protein [Sporosarcina sp. G11-34]|uniref:hypothetical protein n=1 Tax=Sporosarcina sp. G11-34 TaxID=2849605 RepID=UPI0022A9ECF1|nr:hypothetical protein [Sporosarcina sp. G11-34]MCZ2259512.1 hypothetical protein [Sporosarcina sp. G11-34]
MVRSLSFIHLFVILAVGYIGGALLFREMPAASMEKFITIFDARIIYGHEVGIIRPVVMTALFFVVAYLFSLVKQLKFAVLFFGAFKAVLFGLSSAYLLGSGMKILDYSVWWFPFQFVTCLLFLAYCALLSPPFFLGKINRQKRNEKALTVLVIVTVVVTSLEIGIFYFLLN